MEIERAGPSVIGPSPSSAAHEKSRNEQNGPTRKIAVTTANGYPNGNKNLLKPPRIVVSGSAPAELDKAMKPSWVEPEPPPSKCCCGIVRVDKACVFVAILSLFGTIGNATLYFLGLSRLGLSTHIELVLLVIDFLVVLCLLIGISKKSPGLLKPYLFFMALWNFTLSILFIICLWKVVANKEFSKNTYHNLLELSGNSPRARHARHGQINLDMLLTVGLVFLLATLIIIDCIFLHVVYRTFQFFSYKQDRAIESERRQLSL